MPISAELPDKQEASPPAPHGLQPPKRRHGRNLHLYNRGTWTNDEKKLFLIGFRKYGRGKWKKIGSELTTRSLVQIKSHGQKVMARQDAGDDIFAPLMPCDAKRAVERFAATSSATSSHTTGCATANNNNENDATLALQARPKRQSPLQTRPKPSLARTASIRVAPKPSFFFQAKFGSSNAVSLRNGFQSFSYHQASSSQYLTKHVTRPRGAAPWERQDVFAAMALCELASKNQTPTPGLSDTSSFGNPSRPIDESRSTSPNGSLLRATDMLGQDVPPVVTPVPTNDETL